MKKRGCGKANATQAPAPSRLSRIIGLASVDRTQGTAASCCGLPAKMEIISELGRMNKRQLLLQGLNLGEREPIGTE